MISDILYWVILKWERSKSRWARHQIGGILNGFFFRGRGRTVEVGVRLAALSRVSGSILLLVI